MKIRPVVYWASTALIAAGMAFSAELYLTRHPKMMKQFKKLGYPAYFPTILGVFKLLGAAALLSPRQGLLKEWAYAGFTFTFLGAAASHVAEDKEQEAIAPVMSLLTLAASYLTRPADRRPLEAPHA